MVVTAGRTSGMVQKAAPPNPAELLGVVSRRLRQSASAQIVNVNTGGIGGLQFLKFSGFALSQGDAVHHVAAEETWSTWSLPGALGSRGPGAGHVGQGVVDGETRFMWVTAGDTWFTWVTGEVGVAQGRQHHRQAHGRYRQTGPPGHAPLSRVPAGPAPSILTPGIPAGLANFLTQPCASCHPLNGVAQSLVQAGVCTVSRRPRSRLNK